MIKPETLELPPLACTLAPELGDYYQDFSAAIALVESGYHGGFDERGVPVVDVPGGGSGTNAVTVAQYALANMTVFRRGDRDRGYLAAVQLDWLVENQEQSGAWSGCWLTRHDDPKYAWLKAPWTSALTSGNAISALLRGAELLGHERYRAAAEAGYAGLHEAHHEGHLYVDDGTDLWYEEYPADPPLHVLNGHIYTLLAVTDYARVSGDAVAEKRWRRAAETVLRSLDAFDIGYWSVYDLRFREPVSVHYQKNIHVPQLRILAALTGETRFAETADRWERQLESRVGKLRWAVGLRVRRFRRG